MIFKPFNFRLAIEAALSAAIALLGFTACWNRADMYGTPTAKFEIKGSVTNAGGTPVSDASIIMRYLQRGEALTKPGDTVRTNSKGQYKINGDLFISDDVRIVCKPDDSTLEPDSLTLSNISSDKLKKQKINFVLSKKRKAE